MNSGVSGLLTKPAVANINRLGNPSKWAFKIITRSFHQGTQRLTWSQNGASDLTNTHYTMKRNPATLSSSKLMLNICQLCFSPWNDQTPSDGTPMIRSTALLAWNSILSESQKHGASTLIRGDLLHITPNMCVDFQSSLHVVACEIGQVLPAQRHCSVVTVQRKHEQNYHCVPIKTTCARSLPIWLVLESRRYNPGSLYRI